jgi:multisubunit Na+/H+ antiporter MnhG subunit
VTVQRVIIDVLLAIAVFFVLASAFGVLLMRQPYDKVHFVTPAAVVAPVLVAAAVLVQAGWKENSAMAWLALFFMVVSAPVLAHATVRAMRVREVGDWRPGREGTVPQVEDEDGT